MYRLYGVLRDLFRDISVRVRQYILDVYEEGGAFDASKRFTVAAGGTAEVLFENPAGSGVTAYIIDIEITTEATAFVDMYQDSTVSAYGTKIPVLSKRVGSNVTPKCGAYYGGTYTTGNKVLETLAYGGSKNFASGGQIAVGVGIIVPEGHNIHIVLTNPGTADLNASIRIIWYEE